MVTERTERRRFTTEVPHVGGLKEQQRYAEVAFVATGKGEHVAAAQEMAVRLTEKSPINLTPLDAATENVWRGRYDLVIAGSEEPWGTRDVLLGNTERRLVRNSPHDVLIVRHRPIGPSGRIVAAIALDSMDAQQTRLDSETIKAAATFAKWEGSELHVVNVVPSRSYYVFALNAGMSMEEARGIEAEAVRNQRDTMHRFLESIAVDRSRMTVHLLQGNPVQKVANLVSHLDADLLAIGSASRKGIGRLLIGNTAEKVMRQVAASCLVVKPSRSSQVR